MSPLLPVFVLLGSSMLWGLTWLPLKHFGELGVRGPLVTLIAHGSVGVLALPWLWSARQRLWPYRRHMLGIAVFGGLANVAFASAMLAGEVTRVMALFYLLPAWGVLGGRFFLHEPIDAQRALSLTGALLGAFLVLGGPAVWSAAPALVDCLALASGLGLALNNLIFRATPQVSVRLKVGVNFVGCLCWAAAAVALGVSRAPEQVPGALWVELLGFGLIWILVATLGTLWGVNQLETGRSSVLVSMELVTAVTSAALVTGRAPTVLEACGGSLILLSTLLEAWRPARRAHAERRCATA